MKRKKILSGGGSLKGGFGSGYSSIPTPPTPTVVFPSYNFFAKDFDSPNNADFFSNAFAPLSVDNLNNGLLVRQFSDSTVGSTGIDFNFRIPAGATNLILGFVGRAEILPIDPLAAISPLFCYRIIRNNTAVSAWSSTNLGVASIPEDIIYHFYLAFWEGVHFYKPLAALGMLPDDIIQAEFLRDTGSLADVLVGNFDLLSIKIDFT